MATTDEKPAIILATHNPGKLREIRSILAGLPVDLLCAADLDAPEVEETGDTFEANAMLKARAVASALDSWAVADDSGLEVPSLGGAPGVRSARYSPGGADAANNARLRAEIERLGVDRPPARFVCAVALASPEKVLHVARGEAHGVILSRPRGENGFGYDPLFFSPELGKTFAEADGAEKDGVSHRGRAFRDLARWLERHLGSR